LDWTSPPEEETRALAHDRAFSEPRRAKDGEAIRGRARSEKRIIAQYDGTLRLRR
jgi:hypothetical protein